MEEMVDETLEPVDVAEEVQEEPKDPNLKWYVIHTYSGHENKVMQDVLRRVESMGMSDKIHQVLVPTAEEIEFKDGKRRTVTRKIYPGYVFVEMILTDDSWYVVRNTRGVTGFVGPGGGKPVELPDYEVKKLKEVMGMETAPRVSLDVGVGDTVKITSGAFINVQGMVEEVMENKEKLRVLVELFGRETPVEVSFSEVEIVTRN